MCDTFIVKEVRLFNIIKQLNIAQKQYLFIHVFIYSYAKHPRPRSYGRTDGHSHKLYTESSYTVCPGSSDPFYIVSYYIKRVTTSWTHSTLVRSSG